MVEPRSLPADGKDTGPIFARVESHDGEEEDAAAGFFLLRYSRGKCNYG